MTKDTSQAANGSGGFSFSKGYRRYVLAVLTTVYFVAFVDRQIFSVLLQSIKADLVISDTRLGLLGGLAFALFYTTLGVPIAQLADRFSRRNIIVICITLWSVMTAACGMALGFWTLFLARIGVGVGEAGASPPSHSIISDYFPAKDRATALAIFGCGGPLAIGVGFGLGGVLNEIVGWRNTFIIVGLPGVLVGILAFLTVREPPRGHADGMTDSGEGHGLFKTLAYLWKCNTFRCLSLAISLQAFVGYSLLLWLPAFFERTHGLTSGDVGPKLGVVTIIGGILGMLPGGIIADRLAKHDLRWYSRVGAVTLFLGAPCIALTLMSANPYMGMVAFGVAAGLLNACIGPTFTITQSIAPLRMRASATAVLFLIVNLVGIGGGPAAIGLLSDTLFAAQGADSLKGSLMILIFMPVLAALFFWMSASSISRDYVNPHPGKRVH